MRLFKLSLAAVAAAALAAPALAAAPIAKATPAGTLLAQGSAYNSKNFSAMYTAYTAGFKAKCPYGKWLKGTTQQRAQTGPLQTKNITTKIVGSKAFLRYTLVTSGGKTFTVPASAPDVYLKVKGLWYDEADTGTTCPA